MATEALSDSTVRAIGMETVTSQTVRVSRARPRPSDPTTMTSGLVASSKVSVSMSPSASSPAIISPAAARSFRVRTRLVQRATRSRAAVPADVRQADAVTPALRRSGTITPCAPKAAAERMIPQGVGRIVNTSSITAFDGGGTFSKGVYATAKAAVIGMCRGGARELGPHGITVNVLAPGPVDTEIMGGKLTEDRKAAMSAGIPLGRVGQPSEIAATIAFLLSDGAGYISGSTVQVDGAKHMH